MSKFADPTGREWQLSINVGMLSEIKREAKFDLGVAIRSEAGLAELLFADPSTLVSVLWVLCESQARSLDITPEQYAYLFDGPTLERAVTALLEAVADFFPRSKIGRALKANLAASLERMDKTVIEHIEKMSRSTSSNIAGNSLAPADSMPTP